MLVDSSTKRSATVIISIRNGRLESCDKRRRFSATEDRRAERERAAAAGGGEGGRKRKNLGLDALNALNLVFLPFLGIRARDADFSSGDLGRRK